MQQQPPVTKTVGDWFKDSSEAPRKYFDCTGWSVFVESSSDACKLIDSLSVSDYISFCEDCVILLRTTKVFANNKRWATKRIMHMLNRKKKAWKGITVINWSVYRNKQKTTESKDQERKRRISTEKRREFQKQQHEQGVGWDEADEWV